MMPALFDPSTGVAVPGSTPIPGNLGVQIFAFQATARLAFDGNAPSTVSEQSSRTAQTCYMVGLKERVTLRTSTNSPWIWRRICFTSLTTAFNTFDSTPPPIPAGFHAEGSGTIGTLRAVSDLNLALNLPLRQKLTDLIFRGTQNVDWISPIDAPLDPARIRIKYDKRMVINSGNDVGVMRTYSRWHGMRHNLVYNDFEVGAQTTSSFYTANDRRSMGDYYVIDMFEPQTGATADDQVLFAPEARLYWHEK